MILWNVSDMDLKGDNKKQRNATLSRKCIDLDNGLFTLVDGVLTV